MLETAEPELMLNSAPDVAAVQACRDGQADAFAAVVEHHQAAVYGTALRLIGDRDAALEVANTTFYKAYRALESVDLTRPLRPWLVRIASNEALGYPTLLHAFLGAGGRVSVIAMKSPRAGCTAGGGASLH